MDKIEFVQQYVLRHADRHMDEIECVNKAIRMWDVVAARFAKLQREIEIEDA